MTMEPHGPFGPFEVVREIESSTGATVYQARKEGDPKGEYALKLFSPERSAREQSPGDLSALEPLFQDLTAAFVSSVNLQKKAAESSPLFAPILAGGVDERGAWYATGYYPATVKRLLELFAALDLPDLFHVLHSVTKAALHLKRTAGRSHGNLKPSNVLIGAGKLRATAVVVADPLPGDATEARRYEQADLRAIGELLCQLVFRRAIDFTKGMVDVEAGQWTRIFGKQAATWQQLCARLLEARTSSDGFTLERLEAELFALKPKRPLALTLAPYAGGVALLAALAAFLLFSKSHKGTLAVRIDPPRSQVVTFALDEIGRENPRTGATNIAETGALELRLDEGKYHVRAEYHSPYGDLETPRTSKEVEIRAGAKVSADFKLPYGGLIVLSEPPGAFFEINHQQVPTPFTNAYARPGPVDV